MEHIFALIGTINESVTKVSDSFARIHSTIIETLMTAIRDIGWKRRTRYFSCISGKWGDYRKQTKEDKNKGFHKVILEYFLVICFHNFLLIRGLLVDERLEERIQNSLQKKL
jgi:hypothetical protein